MASIGAKVEHVKAARQTRDHTCHWPGCGAQVPPAKFSCTKHWFKLPKALRDKVWQAYRIGQEQDGRPSPQYVAVVREVQDWVRASGKEGPP